MITHIYFVRFRVLRSRSGAISGETVEGSLIMERAAFISTNKDLEDIEQYIARHAEVEVKTVEILALSHLHGLSDI